MQYANCKWYYSDIKWCCDYRDQLETKEILVMMEIVANQALRDQGDHRDHEDPLDHL